MAIVFRCHVNNFITRVEHTHLRDRRDLCKSTKKIEFLLFPQGFFRISVCFQVEGLYIIE